MTALNSIRNAINFVNLEAEKVTANLMLSFSNLTVIPASFSSQMTKIANFELILYNNGF